jgi:hypothetical protein
LYPVQEYACKLLFSTREDETSLLYNVAFYGLAYVVAVISKFILYSTSLLT